MTAEPGPEKTGQVYSYNLDTATTPGHLKVRWRIRIATGAEAERLDQLQQQTIIDLLTWADKHLNPHRKTPGKETEIHQDNLPNNIEIGAGKR